MTKKIIVAIDDHEFESCKEIITALDNNKCMIKIGSIAFNSIGQEIIYYANKKGFEIFLDLKLHDIPNTVKKSIQGLNFLPVNMLTVHISGGKKMLDFALDAVANSNIKIFGVTALTSLSEKDTQLIYKRNVEDQVNEMLNIAEESKIHGVVCSPHELHLVKKRKSLLCITPGIRSFQSNEDQERVMTPKDAIELGADYIVIGREITKSKDINNTLDKIYSDIND